MREEKGRVSIVAPTGERMEAINTVAQAISYNAKAAMILAETIDNLKATQISVTNSVFNSTGGGTALSIETEERETQEVIHYLCDEDGDNNEDDEYDNDDHNIQVSNKKTNRGLYKNKRF